MNLRCLHSSLLLLVLIFHWGGAIPLAQGQESSPSSDSPFLREIQANFKDMKSTLYQHKTVVDRTTGSYSFDCVGFVSYELKRNTPEAWASIAKATELAPGRIPSPPKYQQFFASLVATPQLGWKAVSKASELRAGDIIAWDYQTKTAVGHAVVLAETPVQAADGTWIVKVYDSTASPHQDDSRKEDKRCQPLSGTDKPSGLGQGVIGLVADPETGFLTGYRWSPRSKITTAPIAAGRPSS